MVDVTILPAGNYRIGDLCYDHPIWEEILEHPDAFKRLCTGTISEGRQFWLSSTKYGDGVFNDQYGNKYYVDSGTIGCVRVPDNYKEDAPDGRTFKMEQRFECYYENGKIFINGVVIDTDPSYDSEDDDMNDYESRFELENQDA